MKFTMKVFVALMLFALTGSSSLQAIAQQPASPAPAVGPTLIAATTGLTQEEYAEKAAQAHYITVQIFSEAFEAEFNNSPKLPWSEVRPQLLPYWSEELVDNDLKSFYNDHLWDWGYEMGFAFPLWQPELIEDVQITTNQQNVIIGQIKIPTNYDTVEYLPITLQNSNGNWVIASPFISNSTCELI
ncbi:MAG TPA: hypothetical protein VFC74_01215 [Oscillospiraceae bacterium]|nr:hypothetical protein [Oscillospiraceae bacterium]